MIFDDSLTLYDLLDVSPTATMHELRQAYLKTKATFNQDNVALYSMISAEESELTLKRVEEAYLILSNPDQRRQYDLKCGFISPFTQAVSQNGNSDPTGSHSHSNPPAQVISIDRVPPMESLQDSEALLVPPNTDFSPTKLPPHFNPGRMAAPPPEKSVPTFSSLRETRPSTPELEPVFAQSVEMETEWRGTFIRKVREGYKISLEEMAGITKVTKNYIVAIEEENYSKLPAAVYIRGFITQIAKVLKLPHDKVAQSYLARYYRSQKS